MSSFVCLYLAATARASRSTRASSINIPKEPSTAAFKPMKEHLELSVRCALSEIEDREKLLLRVLQEVQYDAYHYFLQERRSKCFEFCLPVLDLPQDWSDHTIAQQMESIEPLGDGMYRIYRVRDGVSHNWLTDFELLRTHVVNLFNAEKSALTSHLRPQPSSRAAV